MSVITTLQPSRLGQPTVLDRHHPAPRRPMAVPVEPGLRIPGMARELYVRPAVTPAEWEEALQLVTENYQARGFEEAGRHLRFTPYHALPDTLVLVAQEQARVVATFTLVPDNVLLGLPMECLYGAELAALRQAGHRLVETTSLADRDLSLREFTHVFAVLSVVLVTGVCLLGTWAPYWRIRRLDPASVLRG
ncbi:MAG: hypothetical protein JNM56_29705 [Planctomycetia bacterium]|nr:hypothetical protein [Planctomycetia bacterium]